MIQFAHYLLLPTGIEAFSEIKESLKTGRAVGLPSLVVQSY